MGRIIITKKQLNEYLNKKKNEKYFYQILESIYFGNTNLKSDSQKLNYKQSIIDNLVNKGIMTKSLHESLVKHNIINDDLKII